MENNELVKNSIFRQKVYAKRYHVYRLDPYVFIRRCKELSDTTENEFISDDEVFNCNIEMPLLEKDEQFFIKEKQLLVTIKSRCRSSDNSVVYYIEPEYIEDEKTQETYDNTQEQITENKKLKEENEKLRELIPWWKLNRLENR